MSAPAMTVDMRHTKISAADAALIAGEIVKPSWASRNEGIHERISFDDTLWGFELAGGAFYKTPIRVVDVKPGSRADQACIRKGDTVLRINDIDTCTLTLQQAHDIVLESGIHLRISVTSPDDDVDAYYTYEDSLAEMNRLAEELRKAQEAERIRRAIERAQRSCNLPWPWVRRKMIIYRESNCFLVPSTYESKHKEHYPDLPHVRYTDDIADMNRGTQIQGKPKENSHQTNPLEKEHVTDNKVDFDNVSNMDEKEQNKIIDEILEENEDEVENQNIPSDIDEMTHSDTETANSDINGEVLGPDNEEDGLTPLAEIEEELNEVIEEQVNDRDDRNEEEVDNGNEALEEINDSQIKEEIETETSLEVDNNINVNEEEEDNIENGVDTSIAPTSDFVNEEDTINKSEDDNVVDGIVGDGDFNDSINER